MDSVVALVKELGTRDHPMLTWYGSEHERIDLTGRTAANWITKAANLLALETDCHPGTRVWLDLPWHWRAIVWGFAALSTGAELCFSPEYAGIAVTASPQDVHESLETIVVALPALARQVDDLPSWAIDGAADLMTQPDAWAFATANTSGSATGLTGTQRELLAEGDALAEATATGHDAAPRLLLHADDLEAGLALVARAWAQGISIVIANDPGIAGLEGATHALSLPALTQ